MMLRKLLKAAKVCSKSVSRNALLKHRVAAAIEHDEVIRAIAPETLLDIGANKGQFALATRALRPQTTIHAFEPLPAAIRRFEKVFAGDRKTTLHPFALAADEGEVEFHLGSRDDSSSLLPIGEGQQAAYAVTEAGVLRVQTRKLQTLVDLDNAARPVLMKIDVQGGELQVLQGIGDFSRIDHIYVELSFVELYTGQPLFEEVYSFLEERGYRLRGIYNTSFTPEFGMTQVDALFSRKPAPVVNPEGASATSRTRTESAL